MGAIRFRPIEAEAELERLRPSKEKEKPSEAAAK
jgi:hypothetical protein